LSALSYESNASGALWRPVAVFRIVAMVTCVIFGRIDPVSFVARIAGIHGLTADRRTKLKLFPVGLIKLPAYFIRERTKI
jgi:hypothetical protein